MKENIEITASATYIHASALNGFWEKHSVVEISYTAILCTKYNVPSKLTRN